MTNTFQTGLDKNTTISEAISLTMQKFADGHFGDEYKHPFYWAPYQLLGDF
jgi:CHAT domain-containing protein